MMFLLTLLITLPLTAFAVLFAVSNRQDVMVSLWPLVEDYALPLWLVGLGLLGIGFFLGACFVSFQAQRLRFRLWREKNRADRLEKDMAALKTASEKKEEVPPSAPLLLK